ncbi:MAG: M2 family metallopeptidase [Gammaproteobacteria bacterium]|nr:M2 family metallopeptidase [Gammaproteobacteria bacterium]
MSPFTLSRTMTALLACSALSLAACSKPADDSAKSTAASPAMSAEAKPTTADVDAFLARAEKELLAAGLESGRAAWIAQNFITEDTEALNAAAGEKVTALGVKFATEAATFNEVQVSADQRRKLDKLRLGLTLAAPADAAKNKELAELSAELDGMYGKGEFNDKALADVFRAKIDAGYKGDALGVTELGLMLGNLEISAEDKLKAWKGWHTISPTMRPKYQRMVEIANEGAKELGFADTGAMWRAKYDMPADDFAKELDRLWGQVKPLYDSLHCHVRTKLNAHYGDSVVAKDKPIPAHLLGNMWAQEWGSIYDLVKPEGMDSGINLDKALRAKFGEPKPAGEPTPKDIMSTAEGKMVKQAETFFTSLGFEPLPDTFWKRSLFLKPNDRNAVCHASAWDLDNKDDLRIKMCIQVNAEDFVTIHHELGHNFYQRAYKAQPLFYLEGANDGFHEAIGDTIALSTGPGYLKNLGLIEQEPDASKDVGLLMQKALDSVGFLPFGLLIDQWRWQVFSGQIKPEDYNKGWWALRTKYQGIAPAEGERGEEFFDAGAKYHVPGNTPYTRYFLARILQFQFHRDLCKAAGYEGPLHRCSIYGNKVAGEKLIKMLETGSSKPWQEALAMVSGKGEMDATAILDYFAPLKAYLDEQNKGQQCGW